jgi:hypothetical protein
LLHRRLLHRLVSLPLQLLLVSLLLLMAKDCQSEDEGIGRCLGVSALCLVEMISRRRRSTMEGDPLVPELVIRLLSE